MPPRGGIMIVEELIARLGFDVQGVDKLKVAAKTFDTMKAKVSAFATAANARFAAIGAGATAATSKVGRFAALAGGVAIKAIAIALAAVVVAFAAVTAAAVAASGAIMGFVARGMHVAKVRKELQLLAKTMNTKASSVDAVGNFFERLGIDKDKAKESIKALDEMIAKAKEGDAEAAKKLKDGRYGPANNPDRTKRDRAQMLMQGVLAYEQLAKRADAAEKKAAQAREKRAKNAKALEAASQKRRAEADKRAEQLGLEKVEREKLNEGVRKGGLERNFEEAGRLRPGLTEQQEKDRAEVAERSAAAMTKFAAITEAIIGKLDEAATALTKSLLPAIESIADAAVAFAKKIGLIRETVGEKAERQSNEAQTERMGADTARKNLERRERGDVRPSMRGQVKVEQQLRGGRDEAIRRDQSASPPGQSTIDWLKGLISPQTNAAKMEKTVENNDNRTFSEFGNDQRTLNLTVNQTVAGGAEAAAGVKGAAKGILGPSTAKGMSAATAGATAP